MDWNSVLMNVNKNMKNGTEYPQMKDLRKKVNKKLVELETARQQARAERISLKEAEQRIEDIQEAQGIAQQVAQQIQQRAHDQIANVVTRCLETVFDDPYEFRIIFERKRGRTEARLIFSQEGREQDPLGASGGGMVSVAAFALRLACLVLRKPPMRRVLVLDEPFSCVREELGRVLELLEILSEEMGLQILMISAPHSQAVGTTLDFS